MADMDLEFDAPQHFLDFRNLSDAGSDLESYFDVDHEAPEREAVHQQQAKPTTRHGTPAVKRSMQQLRDITNSPGESGRSRSGCKKRADQQRTASVDSAVVAVDDSAAPPLPSRRRRSRSHNSALSVVRSAPLSLSQTPNVLRQGMALRSAARAAAQRAVDDEEQRRQEVFRRQMREFKRRAAESTVGRHAAPQPVRAPTASCTLPQPFSFQQRPGGGTASSVQFKPVAQQINDFQRKTPERFHSRPANGAAAAVNVVEENAGARGVTRGRTPQLATRTRRGRSADLLSTEQLQLLEFQRCQQQAVKPVPLNQNLLLQPLGVPAKQRRPSTAPKPFNLTASQLPAYKQSVRRKRSGSADTDPDRHLQPSFKRSRRSASCDRGGAGSTRPQPFSFQQRDHQRAELKQRKIEQVFAEERRLREFRAQLLPSPTPRGIPERAARPTTRLRPFNLPGLQIHNEAADKHRQKLEDEVAAAEVARHFRAQSCAVTSRAPFQPLPAAHPNTEQLPIRLHSDQRAEQRREYDQQLKQREAELQQQRQQLEEDRRARDECEVQRLRRAAVHRARPVPEYRTFVPQPSSRPLTDANTPSFSRKPAQ